MKRNIPVFSLSMMIFLAVFGFGNIANNYASFGASAVTWFVLLGLFFIPLSLMLAEMASSNGDSSSGLFAWIKTSLGARAAFLGSLTYFIANIFYLPTLFSRIPVFLSWIFAPFTSYDQIINATKDNPIPGIVSATQDKTIFVALTLLMIVVVTVIALKFENIFDKLSRYTGILAMFAAILFVVLALLTVFAFNQAPATPIELDSYKISFNVTSFSGIAWLIFAIAGVESIGGFVNQIDDPVRKLPKAIILSSVIIVAIYAVGVLAISFIGTPDSFDIGKLDQLLSISYARLFQQYGIGLWALRILMAIYFLITLVAAVLWSLANIKVFVSEAPEFLFGKKFRETNELGTPVLGLILQGVLVAVFILITTFGGESLGNIYTTFYDMSTMALILPFIILGFAYIGYRVQNIDSPFKMVKNNSLAIAIAIFTLVVMIFGFVTIGWEFSYLDPESGWSLADTLTQAKVYIGGLLFFLVVGVAWYEIARGRSKTK